MIAQGGNPWDRWKAPETPQQSTQEFIKEKAQEEAQPVSEQPKQGSVPWERFKVRDEFEPTAHNFARLGSRAAEKIAGLPGNIVQGIRTLAEELPGTTGVAGMIAEKVSPGITKKAFEPDNRFLGGISQAPTSNELKQVSEKASKGFTAAQTKSEKVSDERFEDFIDQLIQPPTNKALRAARIASPMLKRVEPFVRALGATVAGHAVKEGVASIGGKEQHQQLAKYGAMFLTGLKIPGKNARQLATDLFQERDAALKGANLLHDSRRFQQNLNDMRTKLSRGAPGPAENEVMKKIDALLEKSQSGMIDIRDLTTAKRNINEARMSLFELPPAARRNAKQEYHKLANAIEHEIQSYGKTQNQKFLQFHNAANEVYGAMQASQVVGNAVQKIAPLMNLKSPVASALTNGLGATAGAAIGTAASKGVAGALPSLGIAAAGTGAYNAGQILYRIAKSPHLAKMYEKVVKSALEGNISAFATALEKLDDAYAKDLERNKHVRPADERRLEAISKRTQLSKGSKGSPAAQKSLSQSQKGGLNQSQKR